ncbi:MAG: NitT/TauT family transport system substrate-binding protein [Clostridiales bacterium]|nr:NitT/TauT family transport system substrate-binding protein [Clostridiales bacterium]
MKKMILIVLCSFLLLIFTGCNSQLNEKITIGLMPDVNSVPFIIAAEKGLFKEQGLNVETQLFMSAVERDAALQAGKIDGCVSDILAVVFARQGGFDVKMTSVTDGDYVLLASKHSNIDNIRDLKNVEIGLSTNTIIEYVTDTILTKNGLKEEEIKRMPIPKIPIRLEMLENGKIYGACLPQPLATLAEEKGAKVIATSSKQGLAPSVMVFNSDIIKQKKQAIKKIYEAYNQAVQLINDNPSSFMDLIVQKAKFPPEIRDAVQLPQYKKAELPKQEDVNEVLNWMEKKGLLKRQFKYNDMVEKGLF